MNYRIFKIGLLCLLIALIGLSSCVDPSLPEQSIGAPVIESLDSNVINIGEKLTIYGTNLFSANDGKIIKGTKRVFFVKNATDEYSFKDTNAVITAYVDIKDTEIWSDNKIVITIPDSVDLTTEAIFVSLIDDVQTTTDAEIEAYVSKNYAIEIKAVDDIEFVTVPAGTFMMGSEYGNSDEAPAYQVTLTNDFIVSKYEISQRIFKQVLRTNPSTFIDDAMPVHNVSRVQALEFCNKLSELNGLDVYYDLSDMTNVQIVDASNGWRLPTEAEWEYFCRAGSESEYPIDDIAKIGDYAFYNLNSGMKPHTIGSKQANAFGLYDVIGNVYEWCWDYSGMYPDTKQTDPTGPATGTKHVVRGGSFSDGIFYLRSSNRKVSTDAAIGLRIVRTAL